MKLKYIMLSFSTQSNTKDYTHSYKILEKEKL